MGSRPRGGYIGFNRVPAATDTHSAAVGVWTLREAEAFVRAGTWPTTRDLYFSSVQLLLHMDGANGSTTFTDSSSAARTVTAVGSAQITTSVSKFGGAGGSLPGSGSYLTVPDASAIELGGGDFAIEFWLNTTVSLQYSTMVSRSPVAFASGCWSILLNNASASSGDIAFYAHNINPSLPVVSGGSVRDGVWHHVAVSRAGTTVGLYVDGTRLSTATSSSTIADISGGINIGRDEFYGRAFTGTLDDLRITIGSARGYTGTTITVPSAAFPDA